MIYDVLDSLSKLSCIDVGTLEKLFDKLSQCICDAVEAATIAEDSCIDFDIKVGKIKLLISDGGVKYKFIPSEKTEAAIIETIINDKNPVIDNLERGLVNKLLSVYKDMF